ncbi:ABC transporter substrate-binding protein [Phytoactinopolyspora halotolerans]|uniref:Extracellular solute-binding protein n=1 Tax=Phytoactinopolyspora halotolerans TaxID=1981512 RepID=A0A6L9SDC9_9ACTN|nr:extracellular solute-binding protein [Phytoactinopolyspora halotolerans]NEE03133.1 extracellular solute-binding protein [Phytoactinopolyspora halotolerans]
MSNLWTPRRMSRRSFLATTAGAAAGLAVAGCGDDSESGAQADGKVQIRFATDWTSGIRGETMEAALAEFEEQNPDISVKLEPIGGDYFDKLQVQFSGGTVADVILFEGVLAAEYIEAGLIADMSATLQKLNVDESVWRPDVPEIFKQDGKRYAVPFQLTQSVWFYNKTLFEQKDVPPPDASWTWDDVLEAAKQITEPPDIYGLTTVSDMMNAWGALGLANSDQHWVSEDLTETMFADPGWAEAITWAIELTQRHQVAPPPSTSEAMERSGVTNPFATGDYGMRLHNSGQVGEHLLDIGDRFEWDLMPTPKAPSGRINGLWNDQGNVVTSLAEERGVHEQAVKLVLHLSGESVQRQIAEDRGSTPTLQSIQESDSYLSAPPENMQVVLDNLEQSTGPLYFTQFLNWMQEVRKQFERGLNGDLSPEDTITAMVDGGNKILQSR